MDQYEICIPKTLFNKIFNALKVLNQIKRMLNLILFINDPSWSILLKHIRDYSHELFIILKIRKMNFDVHHPHLKFKLLKMLKQSQY